jgi:two-component system capsular synthesis sensor histidine kinase RcsC
VEPVAFGSTDKWKARAYAAQVALVRTEEHVGTLLEHSQRAILAGHYSSALGHELRGPAGTVLGGTALVEELIADLMASSDPDRQPELAELADHVHGICAEARNVWDIAEHYLTLMRTTTVDSRTPVEVGALLREVATRSAQVARARLIDVAVTAEIPGEPVYVVAHQTELRQIVLNLVDNALRHVGPRATARDAEPTRPYVRIRLRVQAGGQLPVEIYVDNSGGGIHADVFEWIFQLYNTTTPGGHGIGLPICRRIAGALGGTVHVSKSILGVETTFVVRLPMHAGSGMPRNAS